MTVSWQNVSRRICRVIVCCFEVEWIFFFILLCKKAISVRFESPLVIGLLYSTVIYIYFPWGGPEQHFCWPGRLRLNPLLIKSQVEISLHMITIYLSGEMFLHCTSPWRGSQSRISFSIGNLYWRQMNQDAKGDQHQDRSRGPGAKTLSLLRPQKTHTLAPGQEINISCQQTELPKAREWYAVEHHFISLHGSRNA